MQYVAFDTHGGLFNQFLFNCAPPQPLPSPVIECECGCSLSGCNSGGCGSGGCFGKSKVYNINNPVKNSYSNHGEIWIFFVFVVWLILVLDITILFWLRWCLYQLNMLDIFREIIPASFSAKTVLNSYFLLERTNFVPWNVTYKCQLCRVVNGFHQQSARTYRKTKYSIANSNTCEYSQVSFSYDEKICFTFVGIII